MKRIFKTVGKLDLRLKVIRCIPQTSKNFVRSNESDCVAGSSEDKGLTRRYMKCNA